MERINDRAGKVDRYQFLAFSVLLIMLTIVVYDRICLNRQFQVLIYAGMGIAGTIALCCLLSMNIHMSGKSMEILYFWKITFLVLVWLGFEGAIFIFTIYWCITAENFSDALSILIYELVGVVFCAVVGLWYSIVNSEWILDDGNINKSDDHCFYTSTSMNQLLDYVGQNAENEKTQGNLFNNGFFGSIQFDVAKDAQILKTTLVEVHEESPQNDSTSDK
uniref:Uncharacterized protein n=1 Tax=Acrobeloides nanus TaxID=290746 RepID=A0A914CTL0_9BILA